jgi:4-aminobutyrate--pyruvate transaminase
MPDRPNSAAARDIAYHLHPYTDARRHEADGPLIISRGEGAYVWDDAGNRYIEGLAALWCVSLGFSEERLIEAAVRQMRRLPYYHTFAHKTAEPVVDLAERLVAVAPGRMAKALFANSGSEANDTAIKLARYYNNARGRPEKKTIIARDRGYHGVTLATASLTGLPYNHRAFDLPIAGIRHTTRPHWYRMAAPGESEEAFSARCAQDLERLILAEGPETVAAFIGEPVMGAGGVIPPPAGYWPRIQEVLRKYDILLIADEVICGFGRTGNLFGCQTYGIEPDMVTVAKALSSAYLPIAATLLSDAVYQAVADTSADIGTFGHGYTSGGHPVCAAVALETLKIYEERDVVGHVRRLAPQFRARLQTLSDHPLVGEARGVGLIGAVELVADKPAGTPFDPALKVGAQAAKRAEAHGLIVRALIDNVVAVCPPLIITPDQLDALFDALTAALDDTAAWVRAGAG